MSLGMTCLRNVAMVMLALGLSVGCAQKSGYKTAEVASKRLGDTKSEVVSAKTQISDTVAALNSLVNNPQMDLRPQFQKFSKSLDALQSRAQKARDRAVDMRAKRSEYVKRWQTETDAIQNEELRTRALQRMGESEAAFESLSAKLTAVREASTPFLADLEDLRRYLGTDLTKAGVASVTDLVNKIREEEKPLQSSLDALINELDRVGTDLSPTAK